MQTLKEKSILGLSWNFVQQLATQITLFVHYLLMSHILLPKDYGIVAMLWVFTGCAELIKDLGINVLIVQQKEHTQQSLSTIFWTNISLGFIFSILFWLLSPLIAAFYHTPILQKITQYYACYFLISAFTTVPIVLLEKGLHFKKLFYTQFSATFLSLLISLLMAYYNFGLWSIIAQPILQAIFINLFVWMNAPWFPNFVWEKSIFLDLLKKSLPLLGSNILSYSTRNIDNLLIGKNFNETILGNYSRAYALMQMPFQLINGIIMRVMMPAFAQIQENLAKISAIYLRMISILALLVCPMSIGMMLLSDTLILLLFGNNWIGVVPIFQILAIAGAIQAITSPVGIIYIICQKNALLLKINLITSALSIALIVIGAMYSAKIVAWMVCIASSLSLTVHIHIIGRLIGFSVWQWLKRLFPIFLATLFMALCVLGAGKINGTQYLIFILQILMGIISYILALHLLRVSAYLELKEIALSFFK